MKIRHPLTPLLLAAQLAAPAGHEAFAQTPPTDSLEFTQPPPLSAVASAVATFKQADPSAHFTYYGGHVDSFATKPKNTVPAYAVPILQSYGLSTAAQTPILLGGGTTAPKPSQDLDADLTRKLPVPYEAAANESGQAQSSDQPQSGHGPGDATAENRTQPPVWLEPPPPTFTPPSEAQQATEAQAARWILAAFLTQHPGVFEVDTGSLQAGLPQLQLQKYSVGRHYRRALLKQTLSGEPILDGRTVVYFDVNWNVTGITRMINTPAKLPVDLDGELSRADAAEEAALALEAKTGLNAQSWLDVSGTRGVDWVRQIQAWDLRMVNPGDLDDDYTVRVDAHTGEVLNSYSNVDHYGDAQVLRWGYSSGYKDSAVQYDTSSFYTRDDNTLVHDFFYVMNDERGGGTQATCTETSSDTLWRDDAYGTNTGADWVRATRRSDRDFSLWGPSGTMGSFSESNTYYWGRWFVQWMKSSLNSLGVLPSSASDYPQALIVTNACISGSGLHSSTYDVTTLDNVAEGIPVIRMKEWCRDTNGNCDAADYADQGDNFHACEDEGCHPSPSTIQHELNHFFLKTYYDVDSGLDCATGNQLKFLHEGILGSAIPQAYWHHYYGVGYNPDEDRMYKANTSAGEVHSDAATLMDVPGYLCDDYDDDAADDPYTAGRVAGQAMWELYHGKKVDGSVINTTARPATDTDFLELMYWASDLTAGSTNSRRYEFAEHVMEIIELYSTATSTTKGEWCDVMEHHGLDVTIPGSYCS